MFFSNTLRTPKPLFLKYQIGAAVYLYAKEGFTGNHKNLSQEVKGDEADELKMQVGWWGLWVGGKIKGGNRVNDG